LDEKTIQLLERGDRITISAVIEPEGFLGSARLVGLEEDVPEFDVSAIFSCQSSNPVRFCRVFNDKLVVLRGLRSATETLGFFRTRLTLADPSRPAEAVSYDFPLDALDSVEMNSIGRIAGRIRATLTARPSLYECSVLEDAPFEDPVNVMRELQSLKREMEQAPDEAVLCMRSESRHDARTRGWLVSRVVSMLDARWEYWYAGTDVYARRIKSHNGK
jgi:hypothetical protein